MDEYRMPTEKNVKKIDEILATCYQLKLPAAQLWGMLGTQGYMIVPIEIYRALCERAGIELGERSGPTTARARH